MARIAIIGGGIAGSTAALYLGQQGLDVTLFEKGNGLVSGPPFCHLHAGGNLYRDIPDSACVALLTQSIDLMKFYPMAIDYRPTVIALPVEDEMAPAALLPRLKMLQETYRSLIKRDPGNAVLGPSNNYFRLYSRDALTVLKQRAMVRQPGDADEWMIPLAKYLDFNRVKFPLILVQEYGLNLFRLSAMVSLSIQRLPNCRLFTRSEVTDVAADPLQPGWRLFYHRGGSACEAHFDYLVNASGFRTGTIDDALGYKRNRLVEFKAAYVSQWNECNCRWPEVVFHGKRGTPRGMGQFTPYPDGFFQLHSMTKDITLFENGLAESSDDSSQPKLDASFIDKIDRDWQPSEIHERSERAIEYLSRFIPRFASGKVASKPLYGAQQIPGDDLSLRDADVSFEGERYARCEIVKASSVLTMVDGISNQLIKLKYMDRSDLGKRDYSLVRQLNPVDISRIAREIAMGRGYPPSLSRLSAARMPGIGRQDI